jgi:hypothetical protein
MKPSTLFLLALPLPLLAGSITLETFSNGTIADADAVNANFAALKDGTEIRYQRKDVGSTFTATVHYNLSALDFDNLEVGKTYRLTGRIYTACATASQTDCDLSVRVYNEAQAANGTSPPSGDFLDWYYLRSRNVDRLQQSDGVNVIFTATHPQLTWYINVASGGYTINGASWAMLEELPAHVENTTW